jgi:hypothetical protein
MPDKPSKQRKDMIDQQAIGRCSALYLGKAQRNDAGEGQRPIHAMEAPPLAAHAAQPTHIKDFLREPYADLIQWIDDRIDKAMLSLTDAARSMLAPGSRRYAITRLRVSFFATTSCSSEVGRLVISQAIENGMVGDVELTSGVERIPFDVSNEEMARHADSAC